MRVVTAAGVLCAAFAHLQAAPVMTDIAFTADYDATQQRYVEILPDGFDTTQYHDALIALHGLFADRWQFATDTRDECRAARDAAAERNMIYVSPDYRGPSSMNSPAEADVVQIVNMLRARHRVGRLFMCGASMGGHSSLIFTILHPRMVDGIAAMNCKANMTDPTPFTAEISAAYGGTPEEVPAEYYKRSAEFFPDSFFVPVAMALSGRDDIVPPASSLRLAQYLRDRGKRVSVVWDEYAGHLTVYANARTVLDFAFDSAAAVAARPARTTALAVQPGAPDEAALLFGLNGRLRIREVADGFGVLRRAGFARPTVVVRQQAEVLR